MRAIKYALAFVGYYVLMPFCFLAAVTVCLWYVCGAYIGAKPSDEDEVETPAQPGEPQDEPTEKS